MVRKRPPKLAVRSSRSGGSGQSGGTGFADSALGRFGAGGDGVAQVLCEFKDIHSGLNARHFRMANNRSPVEQCFDYLQSAWQARDLDLNLRRL